MKEQTMEQRVSVLEKEIAELKMASKEAAEILGDMVDVANANGSACLHRRDTERVLRVVKKLAKGG